MSAKSDMSTDPIGYFQIKSSNSIGLILADVSMVNVGILAQQHHAHCTPREHTLGITLALTVAVLWVFSAEFIQYIFHDTHFQKPYFLTYVTGCNFSILLVGFLRRSWCDSLYAPSAWDNSGSYAPVSAAAEPEQAPAQVRYNVRDVARVSAIVEPLYFLANYVFNVGLGLTSASSSSAINNLAPLFTLAIGACTDVEKSRSRNSPPDSSLLPVSLSFPASTNKAVISRATRSPYLPQSSSPCISPP